MHEPDRSSGNSGALLGLGAIALAAVLWAAAAVVARDLFDRGIEPLELAEARSVIALVGLALIPASRRQPRRRSVGAVVVLGISIALVNAVYYLAIERLDVAVALVLQYTAPALVVTWIAIMARSMPRPEMLVSVPVTFFGIVLLSGLIGSDIGPINALGIAFGLASAVMFATYTLVSERAGEAYGIFGALLRGFVTATAMWIAFQIPRGWPGELFEPGNILGVLFVGVGGTLAPFILYLWGVQRVRAERAAIAATLEPIAGVILAWIFLSQELSGAQIAGGMLVLGAVVALQLRRPVALPPEPVPLPQAASSR
jgi:drug/metabolite transporter (DMT)-like permease